MSEKPRFLVGVEKKIDGTIDQSKALELIDKKTVPAPDQKPETESKRLSNEFLQSLTQNLSSYSKFEKNLRLNQIAKAESLSPEEIIKQANEFLKTKVREDEKGELLHFHRTSLENLRTIAEMGRLLSRSKVKELRPDVKLSQWSASDNVMMTRDKYDKEGKLIIPGFSEHGVGASGSSVTLVLKENIMDSDNYDMTNHYPTVADVNIQDYVKEILGQTPQDCEKIKEILKQNNLDLPVTLAETWKR